MFTALQTLEEELVRSGLRAGLAWLNARVPHRFTSVYLFDGAFMNLVELVDKLGEPVNERHKAVPLKSSFCEFTMNEKGFVTTGASEDSRLDGHPAQRIVQSYVGVPVHRGPTELIGTFCHFDFQPQQIDDAEYEFLQDAVTFLSPYVRLPSTGLPGHA